MARSRIRATLAAALIAAAGTIAGCSGGTRLLTTSGSQTATAQRTAYINELNAEQQKLAAAETRIPSHPRTPAAFSRSITLLAAAIRRLANDLAAIAPPASVAGEHARLVGIVRVYAVKLAQAAKIAAAPDGGLRAGTLLISATNTASSQFGATLSKIDTTLGQGT